MARTGNDTRHHGLTPGPAAGVTADRGLPTGQTSSPSGGVRSEPQRPRGLAGDHTSPSQSGTGAVPGRPRARLTPLGMAVLACLAVALLVVVAALTGLLHGAGAPGGGPPPATASTVLRAPAAAIAFDAAGGWLADDQAGTVRRFDPGTGSIRGRAVEVGGRPVAAVAGYGRVWVADSADSQVWMLDPSTGAVTGGPIAVPDGPVSMAAGDGGIWVASVVAGAVSVIDPRTDEMAGTVGLPDGAVRITVGAGDVWVTGQTDTLTRIESRGPGAPMTWRAVRVGRAPLGVAFGDGSVWVANVQSATVTRVDPTTLRVTATYPVGVSDQPVSPEAVALWQGHLWVSDGQQGEVVALDPDAGTQLGSPVPLPGVARQLVLDGNGGLWATTSNPSAVVHFTG